MLLYGPTVPIVACRACIWIARASLVTYIVSVGTSHAYIVEYYAYIETSYASRVAYHAYIETLHTSTVAYHASMCSRYTTCDRVISNLRVNLCAYTWSHNTA